MASPKAFKPTAAAENIHIHTHAGIVLHHPRLHASSSLGRLLPLLTRLGLLQCDHALRRPCTKSWTGESWWPWHSWQTQQQNVLKRWAWPSGRTAQQLCTPCSVNVVIKTANRQISSRVLKLHLTTTCQSVNTAPHIAA